MNGLTETFLASTPALWAVWAVLLVAIVLWTLRVLRRKHRTGDTDPAPPPALDTRPPAKACLVTGAPATHPRPVAVNQRPWWSWSSDDEDHPPELCERYAKAYAIELEHFLGAQRAALDAFGSQQRRDLLAFENGGCVQLLKDARKGGS